MKQCGTCYYWMGAESAYRAPCGLDAAYGDPAFDEGCTQHRPRGAPRRQSITMHPATPRELMEQLRARTQAMPPEILAQLRAAGYVPPEEFIEQLQAEAEVGEYLLRGIMGDGG